MSEHAIPEERLVALLVSHTHWDREWYLPAGRFRQRLVRLIDELLDDASAPFLLDGQAVVLDDYLAVRPEREPPLAARLRDGSLEAGPWYVLADALIPSGEALVRNLLAGRQTLARLGATAPPVLYCPDSFGHPAALPSLAAGFGLSLIVTWRGYGGRRWPSGDTVRWRAGDGATVAMYHLARDGYELASNLPVDGRAAATRWRALRDALVPRSRTGVLLLPNGADHHARQLQWREAFNALTRAAAPVPVHRATLREFSATLLERAATVELPEIAGELCDSAGYVWSLQGTFAARAHQKRRNALVERTLLRASEPQAALARLAGAALSRALVEHAWRLLLLCHPHDTLCGCSTDEVARAMDARLDDALAQARGIRDDAVFRRLGHDPAAARGRRDEWRPVVVVRNDAARTRGGVAEIEILSFIADEPVGPGSSPGEPSLDVRGTLALEGRPEMQLLDERETRDRLDSERHYPHNDRVRSTRVLAWLPPIEALGLRTFSISRDPDASLRPAPRARGAGLTIENERLRVSVDERGCVTLSDPIADRTIDDVITFEDVSDRGDLYTHSPIGAIRRHARCVGATLVHAGPLRAEIATRWTLAVPASLDGIDTVELPLNISFSLDAGASYLRIVVSGENIARDHRLRIVVHTDVVDGETWADAAFGPVRRERLDVTDDERRVETPPNTAPLHRYVSCLSNDRGATLVSDGLAEYESLDAGAIAITLVRAVGELSRNDLPERPGHAGWPTETPQAQCIGPFAAEFALMLHGPRNASTIDAIERVADDVLLPLTGTTVRDAIELPPRVGGLELVGDGLAFSSLVESADGEWIVARCVNLLDEPVRGAWCSTVPLRETRRARLDETPLGPLVVNGDRIEFAAGPREIVTILLR